MTVRARLILTIFGIVALLLIPSVYGVTQLAELGDIAAELQRRHGAAILALGRLQTSIAEMDRYERSYVAAPDPVLRAGVVQSLDQARAQIVALREAGYGDTAENAALLIDTLQASAQRLERLIEADRVQEASVAFEEVKPVFARMQQAVGRTAERIDAQSAEQVGRARAISAAATTTMLVAAAGALAMALLIGGWTTRALTQPLGRLRAAMASVAAGEFVAPRPLPYRRDDEIGDLARSFRTMAEQLAELDRLRAEFISMASHDLKTPINIIGGYSELLEDGLYGELTDRQREALAAIHEQTHVLTRLVQQLVDVSRIEAGGFRVELTDAVVADIFASVQRSFSALAKQKEIRFVVDAEDSVPATMSADADRLRNEVLGNLLSNAFKFTPEGGEIRVHAWREDGDLAIDVSDTGTGIPQDQLDRIFEKYFQVGGDARQMGSGLGLAIAREVIEAHDGRISVQSEVGRGTTFQIRLPIRTSPAPAAG